MLKCTPKRSASVNASGFVCRASASSCPLVIIVIQIKATSYKSQMLAGPQHLDRLLNSGLDFFGVDHPGVIYNYP